MRILLYVIFSSILEKHCRIDISLQLYNITWVCFYFEFTLWLSLNSCRVRVLVSEDILTLFPLLLILSHTSFLSCSHVPLQSPHLVCLLWEKPVLAHPPGRAVNTSLFPVWWCSTELWIHITHSLWLRWRLHLKEVFTFCGGNWKCSLVW